MNKMTAVLVALLLAAGWMGHIMYQYIRENSAREYGACAAIVMVLLLVGAWLVSRALVYRATPAARPHLHHDE
jgi:flagellar biosynthesis protein FliQ